MLYAWRQHPASATWRDPAFSRERFLALKVHALGRGPLRGARAASLVGVGSSLRVWAGALARPGLRLQTIEQGRPQPPGHARRRALETLPRPVVLVFGAPAARRRWRQALAETGMAEGRDFVFVA